MVYHKSGTASSVTGMISSTIRAVAVLLYLGLGRIALSASIPVLTSPANVLWQPVSNVTGAQNIAFR